MQTTQTRIIDRFVQYIEQSGGDFSNWYVGIAKNPRDRLFTDHTVVESGAGWIYDDAGNEQIARNIENYFLDVRRTQGGNGGGNSATKYIYAYRIQRHTNP